MVSSTDSYMDVEMVGVDAIVFGKFFANLTPIQWENTFLSFYLVFLGQFTRLAGFNDCISLKKKYFSNRYPEKFP